jgi:outer membrane protein assembly factor BamD
LKKTLTLIAVVAIALAGCRHTFRGNAGATSSSSATRSALRTSFDPSLVKMSKEQVFQLGEEQFAKKKYAKARQYYSHVYETFPNDPLGRRALLRVADTYYQQGDAVNLVEAQYKYRDFINRYPGSDRADYAMLQVAMCSYKQMERPDRDQEKTREALDKFNDAVKSYPRSPLRPDMDKRMQDVLDRLAKHDHIIARYYIKRKSYNSARRRLLRSRQRALGSRTHGRGAALL